MKGAHGAAVVSPMHIVALIAVQLSYGGFHVVSKYALQEGVNRYVFCAYRDVVAFASLLVFAALRRCLCLRRDGKGGGNGMRPGEQGVNNRISGRRGGSYGGETECLVLPWRSLLVLAISGVFLNQLAFLKGLALTSPVVAGALQPSIPIFTFMMAVTLKAEKLDLRKKDGMLKLVGVVLCALGAFVTSMYQGDIILRGRESELGVASMVAVGAVTEPGDAAVTVSAEAKASQDRDWSARLLLAEAEAGTYAELDAAHAGEGLGEAWKAWAGTLGSGGEFGRRHGNERALTATAGDLDISVKAAAARRRHHVVGVSFLLTGCMLMAVYLTLQQRVLVSYPKPQAVTCWSYAIGGALMVSVAVILEPPWDSAHIEQWIMPPAAVYAVVYGGVMASGFNYTVMSWVNSAVGASVVAMFLPLQPIAGAMLSYTFLGTSIRRGTLVGGLVIAMGLVAVTVGRAAAARRDAREQTRRLNLSKVKLASKGLAVGSVPWIYDQD